jgi:hypothetical protein
MAYFDDAKVGDKVYGLVFGKGKIVEVFEDSFYSIMVEFKNGYEVPYTVEGVPGWGNFKKQTIFYRDDIDLSKADFSPVLDTLEAEDIIRLRESKRLEVRLPSGIWMGAKKAEPSYIENMLESEQYHLFREKRGKKSKKKKSEKKRKKSKKAKKSNT